MLQSLLRLFKSRPPSPVYPWSAKYSAFLLENVDFYKKLSKGDQARFDKRCQAFIGSTAIEAGNFEVSEEDKLLVAASAVIPVWGFPKWQYFNLKTVYLMPGAFNHDFVCGQADSTLIGMVGSGPLSGKMALSRPHLYLGFENSKDKRNVGIHEFVHLVDMMDGVCDGMPERLDKFISIALWFDFVEKEITKIARGKTNIDIYGATNYQEFFAVVSEYFFERPRMLKKRHPELYEHLSKFYRQNMHEMAGL